MGGIQEINPDKSLVFVTCGDWDLKTALPHQCKYSNLRVGEPFRHWMNIKKEFGAHYQTKVWGMTDMLKSCGLELEGRHHSGIDDTRNIARVLRKMLSDGYRFKG